MVMDIGMRTVDINATVRALTGTINMTVVSCTDVGCMIITGNCSNNTALVMSTTKKLIIVAGVVSGNVSSIRSTSCCSMIGNWQLASRAVVTSRDRVQCRVHHLVGRTLRLGMM